MGGEREQAAYGIHFSCCEIPDAGAVGAGTREQMEGTGVMVQWVKLPPAYSQSEF